MIDNDMSRKEKTIDWPKLDKLLIAGYNAREAGAELGVCQDTLIDRVFKQYGVSFSDYSTKFHSKGDGLIKLARYERAIKGNVQLLIYLSEVRLKEKTNQDNNSSIENLLEEIKQMNINALKPQTGSELSGSE